MSIQETDEKLQPQKENRNIKAKYQFISQCMFIFKRLYKWNHLHCGLGQ